ncbi:MAG: lipopolysaccharide assembly protein LapA domain-containing protein [Smithellaceae bacterium]
MNFKIILLLIVAGLAALFIIQNVAAVTVGIFFWEISLSLALLIFFVLTIGFAMGWLLHSFLSYRKVKKEVAEIQRDLRTGKKK